jgi:hypothetical protein
VRKPFEVLCIEVADLSEEDQQLPMGKLAEKLDVPLDRLRDAMDALKMLAGEPTYIRIPPLPLGSLRGYA